MNESQHYFCLMGDSDGGDILISGHIRWDDAEFTMGVQDVAEYRYGLRAFVQSLQAHGLDIWETSNNGARCTFGLPANCPADHDKLLEATIVLADSWLEEHSM